MNNEYDAILVVSFGGPEGPDDVIPFLENVLRGKNVPRERMLEVAEHYQQFGGVSPINGQNRALIAALEEELAANGPKLPIYWGNRNWHPLLTDTLEQMKQDGIQRALGFFTSAFSSYSGCRQYREDIQRAQEAVGDGAPEVDKLRMFFNHPGFIEATVDRAREALAEIPEERREQATILFSAHSIPLAMAAGCRYETQLKDAAQLVSERLGTHPWHLVYQSRSGPPHQPWLEPDICDFITELGQQGEVQDVVIIPIGFVSDHMEVLFDLDTEAKQVGSEVGIHVARAKTVGVHPRFITMIRELIEERISGTDERPALGPLGPNHDVCPVDCCLRVTEIKR
ncbi:ferrochelatase [Gimesia chilikensis]|uniref:Ferrochelatase n=1 Tax=Gimesia chilikensis TaxID=2605989 RepID=A0A517PJL4_9PLAN|nr:ferrochelatase [Gimesia chilikensis]QDT19574.1 Ferrochelatase [Gimesia chilikensis]